MAEKSVENTHSRSGEMYRPEAGTLPEPMRKRVQEILGNDVGDVRVHTDNAASDSAAAQRARAFTIGNDIYFGAGQYDPESDRGARLIFHELAHVVQQRMAAGVRDLPGVSATTEHEAHAASAAMMRERPAAGLRLTPTRAEVARQGLTSTAEDEGATEQVSTPPPEAGATEQVSTPASVEPVRETEPAPAPEIPFVVSASDPTLFMVPLMATDAAIAERFTGDPSLTGAFDVMFVGNARAVRMREYSLVVPAAYAVMRAALDRKLEKDLDWLISELGDTSNLLSGLPEDDIFEVVKRWSGYTGITDGSDTPYLVKFLTALDNRKVFGNLNARDWLLKRMPSLSSYLSISMGFGAAEIVSGSTRYLTPTASPESLGKSLPIQEMSDEDLLREMREIHRWFDIQTVSTDESVLMEQQLEAMQAEIRRRRLVPPESGKKRRKHAKRPVQEIAAPRSALSTIDLSTLSVDELDQELLDLEEWTALTSGSTAADAERLRIEAELRDRLSPRYNLTLGINPSHMQTWKDLRTEEARAILKAFRSTVNIELENGIYRLELRYKLRSEFPIVSRISDFFGGTSIPSRSIWDDPKYDFDFADEALAEDNILTAADHFQRAATRTYFNVRRIIDYANASESGAGTAVTTLKVVKTGSALTVTVIAPYGVFVGAGYSALQETAQQAVEVHYGLRDKIDWGGIAFDAALNIVAGKLVGSLGGKIYGRLLAKGLGSTAAGRIAARITSDLAAGRLNATLQTSGRMAFDALRGKDVTWDQYLDTLADQWTDPTQYATDLVVGEVFRHVDAKRAATGNAPPSPGRLSALSQGTKSRLLGLAMRGMVEAAPVTGRLPADVNIPAATATFEPAGVTAPEARPFNPAETPNLPAQTAQPAAVSVQEPAPVVAPPELHAPAEPTTPSQRHDVAPSEATAAPVLERAVSDDPELDRMVDDLMSSFDTSPPGTGAVPQAPGTVVAPEVAAGVDPTHVRPLGRLTGRNFTDPEIADIGRLWDSVANPGEAQRLTRDNSRRLFDNQRNRFYRALRDPTNPLAVRVRNTLRAAGVNTDVGGVSGTNAPFYELAGGTRIKLSIDHAVERQADPGRALDSSNLRFSFLRENTVVLRLLNELDPMRPPRPRRPWRRRPRRR